jgi:hypothetical protein
MAKLLNIKYPFPKREDYKENFNQYIKESQEALNRIPKNRLFSYPVADGEAYYYVYSFSPLALQHIDYLDGYCLSSSHIRGLRLSDIKASIEFSKIFG